MSLDPPLRPDTPCGPDTASVAFPQVPGYKVLRELGRGGMGVVYEARQEGLNRTVALKMILKGEHASAEDLARFRAEALAIARLPHPNIVQVYAVGTHDGLPFFALEHCPGGTLAQRFASTGHMSPDAAAGLVADIARAVDAAHRAGIIHRDLKPGNVLLMTDHTPKVTDFGLAKQLDSPLDRTQSGAIIGTPGYMSPEQATGRVRDVGPPTDVYALGAVLYEALTGQPPFAAPTAWETLQQVCTREPLPPRRLRPDVPADLEAIVLQCLEKDPKRRYASAGELAADLDRWCRGDPVQARRRGLVYRSGKWLRKHRWRVLTAAAAVLLLGLVWLGLADADYPVPAAAGVQQWLDRHEASLFRPVPLESQLREAASGLRRVLCQHLVGMAADRDGWFAPPNEPTDAWTQMQGSVAVFSSPEADPTQHPKCIHVLDQVFEPTPMCDPFIPGYGWLTMNDGNVSAEPVAWTLVGLGRTLALPNLVPPPERARLLKRLEQVQTILDSYQSHDRQSGQPTGGWNLFAKQNDPGQANVYITLLVCQGLLELCRADLPWHASRETRDRYLDGALAWLLARFDGRGWSTPSTLADQFNDGFSLQVLTTLLQAEAAGRGTLPAAVLEQVPHLVADCGTRGTEHQSPVALFSAAFRNHEGKAVPWAERKMRPIWYAWAVSGTALWLKRCERLGAPRDEIIRTRRVLGHLLLTLGPTVVEEAKKAYTFVAAETLIGLTFVDMMSD